jgi:hypothetical protein
MVTTTLIRKNTKVTRMPARGRHPGLDVGATDPGRSRKIQQNAKAIHSHYLSNKRSTKALSRDYLQPIKGLGPWLSSLRSGQCTSGHLVFSALRGNLLDEVAHFAEAE